MWLSIPLGNPEKFALTVGRWEVSLDNTILGIKPELLEGLGAGLPVVKTWQGKEWTVDSARVSEDGTRIRFGVTVTKNLLPLLILCGGLGIAGVAAVILLVRELRRWLPIGDISRSALPYVAAALVGLFFLVLLIRAGRGFK
jgi:hypothetical protein